MNQYADSPPTTGPRAVSMEEMMLAWARRARANAREQVLTLAQIVLDEFGSESPIGKVGLVRTDGTQPTFTTA